MSIDNEWLLFLQNDNNDKNDLNNDLNNDNNDLNNDNNDLNDLNDNNDFNRNIQVSNLEIPTCGNIYISTQTKIVNLNIDIDIYHVFWNLQIIDYNLQTDGIVKKQIKISSFDKNDTKIINDKLLKENYYKNFDINFIDNPNGIVKYKYIRKISIGYSKKDLCFTKNKQKSAFYNCFVVTLRIFNKKFKEFHVKIFNTGKLEIPGVQNNEDLEIIIQQIITILKMIINKPINIKNNIETILINSNFNCGFNINREKLYDILINKYNVNAVYDPCSYPGIQCSYYKNTTNNTNNNNNNIKISYMTFRTGSILIVGKCELDLLYEVYNFIKNILITDFNIIVTSLNQHKIIDTKKKQKKKIIYTLS